MKHSGWLKRSPMQAARSHFAATAHKGSVYVFGGGGTGFGSLNSTEIYDPKADVWSKGKEMPTTRSGAVAAVLNDKIYVIGGGLKLPDGRFEFFKTVEIYDPQTDTWSNGPDMLMPHDYPASVVLGGGIYVIGGHHPEATKGGPMTDPGFSFCEMFYPRDGLWKEIAPMPTARFALASAVLHNRILAMGGAGLRKDGFKNFDVVESYDPALDKWIDAGFRLPYPAAGLGACVHNNRLFIIGGNSGGRIENRFACHDFDLNKWTGLEQMDEGRIVMGVVTIGDTLYIIGGRGPDGKTPVAHVLSLQFPLMFHTM
ncbi:MAG: hypothetical protein HZA12_01620 [Nitrospirae bacterium]|nr:hypothetical protein [Nitrospirota bacterium]